MDDISNIMGNITRLLALVGGGLAAVAIAYAGIQWMTASGDPQKMAQVRMGVIGAVGGLILVGVAFIIPRVVSQLVVEPAGGSPLTGTWVSTVTRSSATSWSCRGLPPTRTGWTP